MTIDEHRDRRPPWLQAKHSAGPGNPKLAGWADTTLADLYGRWGTSEPIGPFSSEQAAQAAKNALYDACPAAVQRLSMTALASRRLTAVSSR